MVETKPKHDVIVVGAGPAGLACSTELVGLGVSVAVVDEQGEPGGNIYRNVTHLSAQQRKVLGLDYTIGRELVEAFLAAAPDYLPRAHVWQAEATGNVCLSQNGKSRKLHAAYLVLSTGAMERPVPFPGWTLPGVMTCGGMSNLYKVSGLIPSDPVVLAGSGPLLWLGAEHLFVMGAPIAAILDTSTRKGAASAARHLPGALGRLGYMMKGLGMMAAVKRAAKENKTPIYRDVKNLRAEGGERLGKVRATSGTQDLCFDVATLLVHEGVIPETALLRQAGCAHRWNPVQRYWHADVAADGRTNLPSVFVAGDGAFVHGAKSAQLKGQRTALSIARELGRLSEVEFRSRVGSVSKELDKELRPRPFIDALYAPRGDLFHVADDTIVCRCEGVAAGRIREVARTGVVDPNEIKSIIRCGMGPCQGRMCGSAVLELAVEASGVAAEQIRALRQRPPIKPISLEELAAADLDVVSPRAGRADEETR